MLLLNNVILINSITNILITIQIIVNEHANTKAIIDSNFINNIKLFDFVLIVCLSTNVLTNYSRFHVLNCFYS